MKATVYPDMIFLINFIINMILIKVTSLFTKTKAGFGRVSAASCVGAAYAVCMFLPNTDIFYILPFKILVSAIMLFIVFPKEKAVKQIKNLGVFYLSAFTLAGVLIAACLVTNKSTLSVNSGVFYFDISLFSLIAGAFIVFLLLKIAESLFVRNKMVGIKELKIRLGQKECVMSALCDTGNLLTDPISQLPVIIADKKSVMPLFPSGITDIKNLSSSGVRVRVIPYSSLGAQSSVMTGFVPDLVELDGKCANGVIVGISENALSDTNEYNALFNPNILN